MKIVTCSDCMLLCKFSASAGAVCGVTYVLSKLAEQYHSYT